MPPRSPARDLPQRRRRSVAARVTSAYALVTLGFMLVAGWSVVAQRGAAADAAAMRSGYLPLALALRDLVSAQDTYNSQLNHITAAENPADKRLWFETAMQTGRPKDFAQLNEALARAFAGRGSGTTSNDFSDDARTIEHFLRSDAALLGRLFLALDNADSVRAEGLRDELVTRGLEARKRLGALELRVQHHLDGLLDDARGRERGALAILLMSVFVALAIGISVAFYLRRVLAPLGQVTARAKAVARGDRVARPPIASHDELGELSTTFETMVQAISRANQELLAAERLATVGKMAAHVTHEIRNPLSSLALNLELLEEELQGDSEARLLYLAIKREAERLIELSERYLSVARRAKPELAEEDLAAIVRETLDELAPDLQRHHVRCVLQVHGTLPLVLLDASQFRQVLSNLVRNAREAMPEGGRIDVRLESKRLTPPRPEGASGEGLAKNEDAGVELWVEDEGQGIDADTQARLFEPFFTTKGHGTGLGLAIIREIVEAHGGVIRYEQRAPNGTRFRIWLPALANSRASSLVAKSAIIEPLGAQANDRNGAAIP